MTRPENLTARLDPEIAAQFAFWRRLLRRLGASHGPLFHSREDVRLARLLAAENIDLVLDVGGNVGDYAARLRRIGYLGQLVSFEPITAAFVQLAQRAAEDPLWQAKHLALGDTDGQATIHVSANVVSSSFLPMNAQHLSAAPGSGFSRDETTNMARLSSTWADVVPRGAQVLMKLDVQGFELHVLRGAGEYLDEVRLVQAEMSLVTLYDGQPDWRVLVDFLDSHGFKLISVEPGFTNEDGRLLQLDGIFGRPDGCG